MSRVDSRAGGGQVEAYVRSEGTAEPTPSPAPNPATGPSPASPPRPPSDSFEAKPATHVQVWGAKYSASLVPAEVTKAVVNAVRNQLNEQQNVTAQAQREAGVTAAPNLKQNDPTACGPTAFAATVSSLGLAEGTSPESLEVIGKKILGEATTADELGVALADYGAIVERGASNLDMVQLDTALNEGKKVMAMVDSSLLDPNAPKGQPGAPHWVVIDGMNSQREYLVKDPLTGTSQYMDLHALTRAMNAGWEARPGAVGGGGMLVVNRAPAGMSREALREENLKHTQALGDREGVGSRVKGFSSSSGV